MNPGTTRVVIMENASIHTSDKFLAPNAQRQTQLLYYFQQSADGIYTLQSELMAHNGEMLASHTTQYQVQENRQLSVLGHVQVQQPRLYHTAISCRATITDWGQP